MMFIHLQFFFVICKNVYYDFYKNQLVKLNVFIYVLQLQVFAKQIIIKGKKKKNEISNGLFFIQGKCNRT